MKVIHLISGGDSGGAKTHVLSLLQNLNKTITAQLVCFRDGPFADEARAMGIPTMICGGNNVFRVRRQLTDYIRQGGYELIHCHGSRANMIGALLRKTTGLPVVTTVHSDYRLDYMGRPLSHLTFGTINAYALRQLDYRIGVSDAMVDLLISRGFPADRFYAIYNGIDFTPAPPQGDRLSYLRSLGADVDADSVVVGIAARLNPVKDMSTLIQGFAAGYKKCPRLRLVIAGDGEEREKLGNLARELGVEKQVTFAGWISGGMDRFYAALDINALTSLSETFPYALTEGARFHLATVATAVGGIPYLIDSSVNGFLIPPGDWQALGEHLAALGNDDALRRDMGKSCMKRPPPSFPFRRPWTPSCTSTKRSSAATAAPKRTGTAWSSAALTAGAMPATTPYWRPFSRRCALSPRTCRCWCCPRTPSPPASPTGSRRCTAPISPSGCGPCAMPSSISTAAAASFRM